MYSCRRLPNAFCLHAYLLSLLFDPEAGGSTLFRKSVNFYRTAQNPIPEVITSLMLCPNLLISSALSKILKDLKRVKLSLCLVNKY
jgi:hypothetical protein